MQNQFNEEILRRLISLEAFLGVRYSPKDKVNDSGFDEHLEESYGEMKRLKERLEEVEKVTKVKNKKDF